MVQRGQNGRYIAVDDPRLDPIWRKFSEYHLPVIMHIADPIDCWLPLDPGSAHYGYYSNNPEFHFHGREDVFQHEVLMAQRNHIGSLAADVDLAAEGLTPIPTSTSSLAGAEGT